MTPLASDLYVGDALDAARGEALVATGIEGVLRLTHSPPDEPYPESFRVDVVELIDGPQNDPGATRRAIATLRDRLAAGQTTLVHCSAGASRSVCVAAGALACRRGEPFADALEDVRDTHPPSQPHPSLVGHAERAVERLRAD